MRITFPATSKVEGGYQVSTLTKNKDIDRWPRGQETTTVEVSGNNPQDIAKHLTFMVANGTISQQNKIDWEENRAQETPTQYGAVPQPEPVAPIQPSIGRTASQTYTSPSTARNALQTIANTGGTRPMPHLGDPLNPMEQHTNPWDVRSTPMYPTEVGGFDELGVAPAQTAGAYTQYLLSRGLLGEAPVSPAQRYISQFASPIRNIYDMGETLGQRGFSSLFPGDERPSWMDYARQFGQIGSPLGTVSAGVTGLGLKGATRAAARSTLNDLLAMSPDERASMDLKWGRSFDSEGNLIESPSLTNLQSLIRYGLGTVGGGGGLGASWLAKRLPRERGIYESLTAQDRVEQSNFLDWLADRFNFQRPRSAAPASGVHGLGGS
jgi:hypothetical protein